MSGSDGAGYRVASNAIDCALAELRCGPGTVAVVAALDQAWAAVSDLNGGLTAAVLARELAEIERCHRLGKPSSPHLEACQLTTEIALILAYRDESLPE
jgi:hypothetical protein